MSKKNKMIIFIFSILIIIGAYLYIIVYNRPNISVAETSPEIEITSENLILSFITNEKNANSVYKEKVIQVDGIIKEINFLNNRNTILLHSNSYSSSVLCDMEANQIKYLKKLKEGNRISLKGICKGFLKDVILLNCILINKTINE